MSTYLQAKSIGSLGSSTDCELLSWGFNTETYGWTQYDVFLNVSNRPSWGAYAEMPEHGLAFYLNGAIDSMSSWQDYSGDTTPQTLQGMVVLDLKNHKASFVTDLDHIIAFVMLKCKFAGHKHIH